MKTTASTAEFATIERSQADTSKLPGPGQMLSCELAASPSGSEALLDVADLATRLQVRPSWVYDHADELGAFRLGKYLRFSWARVVQRMEVGLAG